VTQSGIKGVVFLVTHDQETVFLIQSYLASAELRHPLKRTGQGNEAFQYLKGSGFYRDRVTYPLPSVILLDLHNPDGSSMAFIGWVREHSHFNSIPIILLVESGASAEAQKALDLGANGFIRKGDDLAELGGILQSLENRVGRGACDAGEMDAEAGHELSYPAAS
jgi:CheY-like chemotaxis protein